MTRIIYFFVVGGHNGRLANAVDNFLIVNFFPVSPKKKKRSRAACLRTSSSNYRKKAMHEELTVFISDLET